MPVLKVAAIQMCSGRDIYRNIDFVKESVVRAANAGAHYVQTPEMTGFLIKDPQELAAKVYTQERDPLVHAVSILAQQHQIYIHIGSTAILKEDGSIANRSFLFSPDGSLLATYDKIHMFDVDLDSGVSWRESHSYCAGTEAVIASTSFGVVGFGICYDVRFAHFFSSQASAGAEILTVPAAFTKQTGEAHWHVLLRARAIENGAFVIAAAQVGLHEDGRETFGHSMIIDPWGRIMVSSDGVNRDIIYADIDLDQVCIARKRIPNLKNSRVFSLKKYEDASCNKGCLE
jgi:deaminated glutathione amidase